MNIQSQVVCFEFKNETRRILLFLSLEATESVVDKLNNAELWFSNQSSHMPMYEDVDSFFTAINEFLSEEF